MFIKIHKAYRDVIAICDKELLGKQFEEKEKTLNIRESFYKGEEKSQEEIIELMKDLVKEDATFNIVGEKSVACALKAGIIKKQGIKKVSGIPYALILM